jgi:hypothetical protein
MVEAVEEEFVGKAGKDPAVEESPEAGSGGKVPAVEELPEAGSGGKAGMPEEEPAGVAACELSIGGKGGISCAQAAPNDMSMKDKTAMSWVIPLAPR